MTSPAFDIAEYNGFEYTRYRDANVNTKGPGDARPTALQIVKDNDREGKLTDKNILITGCSSGIGIETARALKATGAHIFCTARSLSKGQKALADILEPGKVDLMLLDLNSLASVRKFSEEFLKVSNGKLNILINNAGVMETPEGKTEDGFETQFGTNHLAHFLLFQLLKPALLASSTPDFNSRVVAVASIAHRYVRPKLDNIMLAGEYKSNYAYAHSKTANIWFANKVDRKYGGRGLHALSLDPGGIWTGLQAHVQEQVEQWKSIPAVANYMKSPEQGAATTVWAAVGKVWEGKGGRYLEGCSIYGPAPENFQVVEPGYVQWTYDPENEAKMWKMSNDYVGFKED